MSDGKENKIEIENSRDSLPEREPIEPERTKLSKARILRWLLFLIVIFYTLITLFHEPILKHLGEYLIVEHEPKKSDLIVCLAGGNIERGLATADAFNQGLASSVFITREKLPDSYELLKEKGVEYPENSDLMKMLLIGCGVPESAIFRSDKYVESTLDEALLFREIVKDREIKSLIIITSPIHSRRAWLTFMKVLEESGIKILMIPSGYSKFKPENWWKNRSYVREVIIEYQKLIFHKIKYGI